LREGTIAPVRTTGQELAQRYYCFLGADGLEVTPLMNIRITHLTRSLVFEPPLRSGYCPDSGAGYRGADVHWLGDYCCR
jgi:hypothetical protein